MSCLLDLTYDVISQFNPGGGGRRYWAEVCWWRLYRVIRSAVNMRPPMKGFNFVCNRSE